MQIKMKLTKLIDRIFGKPAEESTGNSIQTVVGNSSLLCKREVIDDRQILIDAVAVDTMLEDAGYNPIQVLKLLTKMYGAIASTVPKDMRDPYGKEITPKILEDNFFISCSYEREAAGKLLSPKFKENRRLH